MTSDVFVSYSQPDRDIAFELVSKLEAHDMSVWIAPRDISPAADWAAEIIEAISTSRLMVLVFSEYCNTSPQVCREVERAVHRKLPILPFRMEDVLPARSLEYFLSSQHWFDAFPPPREPHYAHLIAHITALLRRIDAAKLEATANSRRLETPVPPVSPPRAVLTLSPAEMEALEKRLAQHVGPVARYLVKQAAAKATDREQLLALLAAEVESDPARRQFLEACRAATHPHG